MDQILRLTFKEPDRQAVQEEAASAVERDPQPFLQRYRDDPRSFGGRYVCADLFKEQFPAFAASREARNRYNSPVHNAAAVLASEQFRRNLQDLPLGSDRVIFLTGVPGAGKTSTLLRDDVDFPSGARMVFEGQLARPETSLPKIGAVLDAGLRPEIVVVHVMPELAQERTLLRFENNGRGASMQVMAAIQGGLPDGLEAVRDRFGDAVRLMIYDNREIGRPRIHDGWENLDVLRSEGNREQIEHRLAAAIDDRRNRGLVSEDGWRQARGLAPLERSDPGLARIAGAIGPENRQGPGAPGEPAQAQLLSGAQRLVVMDGQATLQRQGTDGRWADVGRRPAGSIPSGNWSMNVGESARAGQFVGAILHVDPRSVYQLVGRRVIRHERSAFDAAPEPGTLVQLVYDRGRVQASAVSAQQGRGRGRKGE